MARARGSSGGTGWAIATVIFGFAFLVSLVLAIVFASQVGGARENLEQLEQDTRQYIHRAEKVQERFVATGALAKAEKKSLVGYLHDENTRLKALVGFEALTVDDIKKQLGGMVLEGTTLVNEVKRLKAELAEADERAGTSEDQVRQATTRVEEIARQKAQLGNEYTNATDGIRQQLEDVRSGFTDYKDQLDGQVKTVEDHLKDVRKGSSGEIKTLARANSHLRAQVDQLERRLREAEGKKPKGDVQLHNERDGVILSLARGGRDMAYVDLARHDRVLPGMTFEVFDKDTLIRSKDLEDSRGKATIELVNVLESASEARIVRRGPDAVVVEGDQIANLAYDRSTVFEFFVHGMFDVDRTGRATMGDNRRIQQMISNWGGEVTNDLTFQTDYLVVGLQPPLAEEPADDAPVLEWEEYQVELRVYEEYQNLVAQARGLKIPVLNQNRFLALVGYYRR